MESLKTLQIRSQSGDKAAKEFLSKVKSTIIDFPMKSKAAVTFL